MAIKYKPSSPLKVGRVTKTLNEWAAGLGCPVQTILGRLHRGDSPEDAVSKKVSTTGGATRGQKMAAEVLTSEECQKILDQCNDGVTGCRNRAMIVVGWRSGLRISEVLALQPHNVDLAAQSIRVLHGKGDKARTVGIDATAIEHLVKWISARDALAVKDKSPLFCTLAGGPLSDRYVRELMPRLASGAGIKKRVHFHGLRHTHAAELASEGVPMNEIQQQLGHTNLAVTSKYLAHINPAQTVDRMKNRGWVGHAARPAQTSSEPAIAPPDWVDQVSRWIGDKLVVFHDGRKQADQYKAIFILTD